MCQYGTYKLIKVNHRNLERCIDACIADEIKELNKKGILTLGCCCGHGEYEPCLLVDEKSVGDLLKLNYQYETLITYTDIKISIVHQFKLKTGCKTTEEIKEWHKEHKNEKFFKGFANQ